MHFLHQTNNLCLRDQSPSLYDRQNEKGVPVAESADFLRDEEKIRVDGGINETYRAIALSRAVQLAEAFQLTQTIDEQYVDSLRTKIETLKPKQVKALARGAVQVAALFGDVIIERVAQAPEVVVLEDVVAVSEPTREPIVEQTEAPESLQVEISDNEAIMEIGEQVQKLLGKEPSAALAKVIGPFDDLNITTDDAARIAKVLVELRGPTAVRKNTLDYTKVLTSRYQNVSLSEIAQENGTNSPSLQAGLYMFMKKIQESHGAENVGELFRAKFNRSEAEIIDEPVAVPVVAEEATQVTVPEVKIEAIEVERDVLTYAEIANELADRLSFDKKNTQALREFLNPFAGKTMSIPKKEAIDAVVAYVTEHFQTIDNPLLNLSDDQRYVLRHVTGAWYSTINGEKRQRTPKTVSSILTSQIDRRRDKLTVELFGGFRAILDADLERITAPEPIAAPIVEAPVTPKPQAPKARLRIAGEAIVPHEEWRAEANRLLQARWIELGYPAEQADTVWSMVHFDDEGYYKQDTPERRAVMATLQDKLSNANLRTFTGKKDALTSVKMLTTAAFGLKTLDDIHQKLLQKYPAITKETVEKEVVKGVGILLR